MLLTRVNAPQYHANRRPNCTYFAQYVDEHVLQVYLEKHDERNADCLSYTDKGALHSTLFRGGIMIEGIVVRLDEKSEKRTDLMTRDNSVVLERLSLLQQFWRAPLEEIFQINSYLAGKRDKFSELFVDESEFRHGPAYELLQRPFEEQRVLDYQSLLLAEETQDVHQQLVGSLAKYALEPTTSWIEIIDAMALLEKVGEKDIALGVYNKTSNGIVDWFWAKWIAL